MTNCQNYCGQIDPKTSNPILTSCGSTDADIWQNTQTGFMTGRLLDALSCAESQNINGACSSACTTPNGVNNLIGLTGRVNKNNWQTTLPTDLSETCLDCIDKLNAVTGQESPDAECPGFRKVYNCALCRQQALSNWSANSPSSGMGPADPNFIDEMNTCCCGYGSGGNGGGGFWQSTTGIAVIVGIVLVVIILIFAAIVAFRSQGTKAEVESEIGLADMNPSANDNNNQQGFFF